MIKRAGIEVMNKRSKNVAISKETLDVIKNKSYTLSDGTVIDITFEVDFAINGTRLYTSTHSFNNSNKLIKPKLEVTNETTAQAAKRLLDEGLTDLVALNFASARNVGGGFLGGAIAQEEDLCRASALYACTKSKPVFYNENILCDNTYYTDNIIYSPNVPFFRDEYSEFINSFNLSIITAPAPNVTAMNEPNEETLLSTLSTRAAKILQVAHENKHKNIILGAWGCGAFGNSSEMIANVFVKALHKYPHFENVCFAIFDNRPQTPVYETFKQIILVDE